MVRLWRLLVLLAVLLVLVSMAIVAGAQFSESIVMEYAGVCYHDVYSMCAVDVRRGLVRWSVGRAVRPADAVRMVYSTARPGDVFLYDGNDSHNMTDDAVHNTIPALSVDGVWLAYADRDNEGGTTLRLMNTYSRSRSTLQTPQGNYAGPPVWSPDASAFLYLTALVSTGTQVWRVPVDGGKPVRLGVAAGTRVAWSPDGRQVAYVTPDRARIFIADALSGNTVAEYHITAGQDEIARLAWAPDGERIAFLHREVTANFSTGISVDDTRLLHIESGEITRLRQPVYRTYDSLYWANERYIVQAVRVGAGVNIRAAILLLDTWGNDTRMMETGAIDQVMGLWDGS